MTDEELRILLATRDRKIHTNAVGRWVIDGDARPERKARERLVREQWIEWTWQDHPKGEAGYLLTDEGWTVLRRAGLS
jgi:hypothetical protein